MLEMIERTDVNITKWEKKRRRTLIVYLIQNVVNGVGLSLVDITSWYYVTTLMNTSSPKLMYGLVNAMVYFVPMLLLLGPVSTWLSKKREIRRLLIGFNLLNLLGSFLYAIPDSPYYAISARLLYGGNLVLKFVMTSELFHSYTDDELVQKITLMSLGVFFGEGVGAAISLLLLKFHFRMGSLTITYGNACVIPLITMTIVQLVLIIGASYNVSNEYDPKIGEIGLNNSMLVKHRGNETDRGSNDRKSPQKLDLAFLLCMSFYCGIWIQLPIRLLPLVVERLVYPKELVIILYLGYSILNVIVVLLVVRYYSEFSNTSTRSLYWCELCTLFLLVALSVCIHQVGTANHMAVNSCLLGLMILSKCAFNLVDRVYIIVSTAKLIYNANKGCGDGCRLLLYFLGRVVGSTCSVFIYDYFTYLFFGHIVICLVFFLLWLFGRRL